MGPGDDQLRFSIINPIFFYHKGYELILKFPSIYRLARLTKFIFLLQTLFAKGAGDSLDVQAQFGYETLGLDWTVDPVHARKVVGENITLQGNLDPQDLYKTPVSHTYTYIYSGP